MKIGFNGSLDVDLDKVIPGVSISFPVADASFLYEPGLIAFAGATVDPFHGSTVAEVISAIAGLQQPQFELQGYYNTDNNNFAIQADVSYLRIGDFLDVGSASLTISNTGIAFDGMSSESLIGQINLEFTGEIDFNGNFILTASAEFDLGPLDANANFTFTNENGPVSIVASLDAGFQFGSGKFNVHGSVTGNLDITFDDGFQYSGDLHASGGVSFLFVHASISVGAEISDDGLTINLPIVPDIHVTW